GRGQLAEDVDTVRRGDPVGTDQSAHGSLMKAASAYAADAPRGIDDSAEGRLDLVIRAGLQTAVGVDPDPVGGTGTDRLAQQVFDLVPRRYPRRMDVVHARPEPAPEPADARLVEDPPAGPGRLDRGHVGVERIDGGEDLLRIGVTQVRVDLG